MKGKLLVLGILILVAIIFVPSEEKCDFLPGLKTRASYFTDRLVIRRISIGPSPQSEGADIQAGIKIPVYLQPTVGAGMGSFS